MRIQEFTSIVKAADKKFSPPKYLGELEEQRKQETESRFPVIVRREHFSIEGRVEGDEIYVEKITGDILDQSAKDEMYKRLASYLASKKRVNGVEIELKEIRHQGMDPPTALHYEARPWSDWKIKDEYVGSALNAVRDATSTLNRTMGKEFRRLVELSKKA